MTHAVAPPQFLLVWPNEALEIDSSVLQGLWTEAIYLKLTDQTNRMIEFTDGVVEVLPMPTRYHQAISLLLMLKLLTYIQPRGGVVYYAPLRLQIRPGKYREPDILLLRDVNDPRNQDAAWLGADLVIEIVSPHDPERDTVTKRIDYAEAAIPEYWIVNPIDQTITVLAFENDTYSAHGRFHRNEDATSLLLAGFSVSVAEVFDAQ
ncbi:MAG: Uma2 family endonuclease [Roseiflexaceae bacterium]|nr:Uma2 family endonuclease [Roseiflexaceae bacterium]